jgi:formiminoglutamase
VALSTDPHWPRSGDWTAPTPLPGPSPLPGLAEGPEASYDLALIGIPTFSTSLSATNANQTPAAVRAALRYYSEFTDRPLGLAFADYGDSPDPDGDEDAAAALVARAAAASRLVVALGGDNAATVPAALGTWGSRIATAGLVTLDAHHDLRDGRSNGSPVRRLIEAGLSGTRVVQVGIADFANSADYAARAADLGITVVRRGALLSRPIADVVREALDIAAAAGGPVHVDLDIDVCDRSVAPACPASIPGGIAAHELRAAARAAGAHRAVESIDLVEVDATADAPDGRTVRLVALCVLEAAAGLAER